MPNEHDNALYNIIIIKKNGCILVGRMNNKYFYSHNFITAIYNSDVFNIMLKINIFYDMLLKLINSKKTLAGIRISRPSFGYYNSGLSTCIICVRLVLHNDQNDSHSQCSAVTTVSVLSLKTTTCSLLLIGRRKFRNLFGTVHNRNRTMYFRGRYKNLSW